MYNCNQQTNSNNNCRGLYLEGITTCVNYSDFLDYTLHENLGFFDEFVVVTTPSDKATQAVCAKHGVICVQTEVFYEKGDAFNKGMAINLGIAHLRHSDWLVHVDADIALPPRFRTMLDKARIEQDCIYGADRATVITHEKWAQHKNNHKLQYHHKYLLDIPANTPIGARLVHNEFGYCPIGYFQLWHGSQQKRYPINQGSAEHTDVLFACQWKPEKRVLLPSVIVYHLESERAKMGTNWNGRITKKFGN